MLKITLNINEYYLIKELLNKELDSFNIQKLEEKKIILVGKRILFEELIDSVGDIILKRGIDNTGNLNVLGNQMEKIIDVISERLW